MNENISNVNSASLKTVIEKLHLIQQKVLTAGVLHGKHGLIQMIQKVIMKSICVLNI